LNSSINTVATVLGGLWAL